MRTRRSGFTVIEMLIVMVLGAIILGVGTKSYARAENRRAVINARDAMILTAYRARSEAVRTGRMIYLDIDPEDGLVEIATSDSVLATLDADDYGARMVGNETTLCYTGRGYALPSCGDNLTADRPVGFIRGRDTARVVVLPLGQIRRSP
ncbi:MAG: prepilin-type N-terminal cleavage/methylation domain-containing protein [Gemmatimonadetes bacterium]|nr:prepilin-type N-terminal cleavage/methylation domain-containing protein [Gemmatimonadota bacterium]NIQ56240.1 prepilin-type N-terminal cleavage/methylation domain-containing protein [Gemmatimonadota bacterium]NIU76428.1 prepilin-type N-terminal cleavage/methylation domain-containing protein [Gammaproteobacteria bacterium]NIX45905.1 prepilin-type N-terminal cleavage/methylation domain-containing protein [Gemmatimonadota bacterium]NIY10217.1 prepilin-type N-terminal cleavage/methylation domain